MTVRPWASVHNTRTLKLKQLNGTQPTLILLFTPVFFLLWHVKVSTVKKLQQWHIPVCYRSLTTTDSCVFTVLAFLSVLQMNLTVLFLAKRLGWLVVGWALICSWNANYNTDNTGKPTLSTLILNVNSTKPFGVVSSQWGLHCWVNSSGKWIQQPQR